MMLFSVAPYDNFMTSGKSPSFTDEETILREVNCLPKKFSSIGLLDPKACVLLTTMNRTTSSAITK